MHQELVNVMLWKWQKKASTSNILIIDKNEIDTKETKQKIEGFGVKCSGLIYDFGNLGNPSAASEFIASLNTGL